MILWLTLAQLGSGLLIATWLLRRAEVGEDVLRFLGVMAAVALAPLAAAGGSAPGRLALAGAALAGLGGLLLSWGGNRPGTFLVRAAAVPAMGAVIMASLPYARAGVSSTVQVPVLAFDAFTSAALLGITTAAMILGHGYLVNTGMPIAPLQRLTAAIVAATVLKALVVAGVFLTYGWPPSRAGWMMTLLIPPGLFYLVRIGFGLLGPLAMAPMIWHTAKIHSTQSATGILYATVFLVLVGEMTANFLLMRTPFPF